MLFLLPKLIILIFQPACRPLMSTEEEKNDDEDVSEADEEELEEGVE